MNPRAGARCGRARVTELTDLLIEQGLRVEIVTDLDEVATRAAQCHAAGELRALVAAGGDGTAQELVNRTPPGVPLAILPLGTENLLAKYLEIARTPASVASTIVDGAVVRLDAAQAAGRVFLLMAGCGFDAEVVRQLHAGRSGHIRHWSYAKPIFDSIRNYRYPELRIAWEGQGNGHGAGSGSISARWAFIVNLPRYAARLRIAPEALGTDGLLDVCTFRQGSLWHGLRYLWSVVHARHPRMKDCTTARVQRVRIESDEPVPYQLDGDPGGFLPLTIEVLPQRLTLVAPKSWAVANGFEEETMNAER